MRHSRMGRSSQYWRRSSTGLMRASSLGLRPGVRRRIRLSRLCLLLGRRGDLWVPAPDSSGPNCSSSPPIANAFPPPPPHPTHSSSPNQTARNGPAPNSSPLSPPSKRSSHNSAAPSASPSMPGSPPTQSTHGNSSSTGHPSSSLAPSPLSCWQQKRRVARERRCTLKRGEASFWLDHCPCWY